jgi:hypothetical protein
VIEKVDVFNRKSEDLPALAFNFSRENEKLKDNILLFQAEPTLFRAPSLLMLRRVGKLPPLFFQWRKEL